MKHFLLCALAIFLGSGSSLASFRGSAQPYIYAALNGHYYARCVPSANGFGAIRSEGTTSIYKVDTEQDKLLDRYEVFSEEGVFLVMPEYEKMAAMILFREAAKLEEQVEFSYHWNGRLLKSHTTRDLLKMGAKLHRSLFVDNKRADIRILGAEWIADNGRFMSPGAWYWAVEIKGGNKLLFDTRTGELVEKPI